MRLTTKIILSVVGSIFILSLLFIIGFSFSERRHYTGFHRNINEISIPQDNQIGINLDPHRVIVIEEDFTGVRFEDENRPNSIRTNMYIGGSNLIINQIMKEMENKLYIPEALNGCIATKMNDDTLTIQIKYYELRKKYDNTDSIESILFSGVNLCLQISNVNIINKMSGSSLKVSNIETDSVVIDSRGNVLIESCKANFINPVFGKLTVKNSVVKTMLLDLDRRSSTWNLEGCEIENQNLTGSGRHNITLHRNETGTINWHPKNKDAELNIKVSGDTTQIVYK